MTPQPITLVTLGVADLDRATAFYTALGWSPVERAPSAVFFDLGGMRMALFGLADLARDQDRPVADLGTGAATLAQNFPSPAEVDIAYRAALAAGATPLKAPESVFWGGYSGYYADPDGHVWEVAHNPFWPLDDKGRLA